MLREFVGIEPLTRRASRRSGADPTEQGGIDRVSGGSEQPALDAAAGVRPHLRSRGPVDAHGVAVGDEAPAGVGRVPRHDAPIAETVEPRRCGGRQRQLGRERPQLPGLGRRQGPFRVRPAAEDVELDAQGGPSTILCRRHRHAQGEDGREKSPVRRGLQGESGQVMTTLLPA